MLKLGCKNSVYVHIKGQKECWSVYNATWHPQTSIGQGRFGSQSSWRFNIFSVEKGGAKAWVANTHAALGR